MGTVIDVTVAIGYFQVKMDHFELNNPNLARNDQENGQFALLKREIGVLRFLQ